MDLPHRVHRNSEHQPGKYTTQVLKMLEERNLFNQTGNECQPESTASSQMERECILAGRENQHGSSRRSGGSIKHSRESETVDNPSSGLHRHANSTNQFAGRMKARRSKVIRRSITLKTLAADLEVLKNEVQDLKELVSSQSLPNKRSPKKRVTFQDNAS